MNDDLVKRLRAEDPECGLRHSLAMEAADCIEELLKFKSLHSQCDKISLHMENKLKDMVSLYYAEANKYEKALQEIIESARLVGDYHHVKIARAALGEKKDG
jgi:hypothetical protein